MRKKKTVVGRVDLIDYAVGIPTRGRTGILCRTVQAFLDQTLPPKLILVVDNNDEFGKLRLPQKTGVFVTAVRNRYPVPSDAHGSQTALEIAAKVGCGYMVKWDDDLVPEPNCMEKLADVMKSPDINPAAVGGVYPKPGDNRLVRWTDDGQYVVPDDDERHVQFWQWNRTGMLVQTDNLYSSFLYRVDLAYIIGGFCLDYSQHSFRQETDFSMRLAKLGDLYIRGDAVAWHHWEEAGGTRAIQGSEKEEMLDRDLLLFVNRMRIMNIFPKEGKNDNTDTEEANGQGGTSSDEERNRGNDG